MGNNLFGGSRLRGRFPLPGSQAENPLSTEGPLSTIGPPLSTGGPPPGLISDISLPATGDTRFNTGTPPAGIISDLVSAGGGLSGGGMFPGGEGVSGQPVGGLREVPTGRETPRREISRGVPREVPRRVPEGVEGRPTPRAGVISNMVGGGLNENARKLRMF